MTRFVVDLGTGHNLPAEKQRAIAAQPASRHARRHRSGGTTAQTLAGIGPSTNHWGIDGCGNAYRTVCKWSMTEIPGGTALCPSAPAQPGAALIGLIASDGHVAHLGTPLVVDNVFLEEAKAHGTPEKRFRFAASCRQHGCVNWTGEACGLINELHRAASAADLLPTNKAVPRCPMAATRLRRLCRLLTHSN